MELRPDDCYGALLSRDARFDGRFFTGVTSTGVYCRPICPANPPKRENCRFFPSAAAAEAAGFRPCLRCRPETAPGTPAWLGTLASVTRALRLIEEGILDTAGVDVLAARLGMGARQLRRLFHTHLGAGPLAVAHTRRVQIAKRLIDDTDLSMIDVAYAAGFGSVRRFNAAVRRTYGRPPRALRRRTRPAAGAAGGLTLRLSYRPPYDWQAMRDFLALRAIPGVEAVGVTSYRRSISAGEARGVIEVTSVPSRPQLLLFVPAPLVGEVASIVTRVRRLFDLDADPQAIAEQLARDPLLEPLVRRRPGLRVPGAWDGFELTVRAILGQQVSVRAATTMAGRLARAFGESLQESGADGVSHLFPGAAALSGARLERVGLTRARAEAIRGVASAVCDGALLLDAGADRDVMCAALRRIRGIGEWTAEYVAMRALARPDAFPATDLGLRRAVGDGIDLGARAEAWRPWRAYAALHLWNGAGAAPEPDRRQAPAIPDRVVGRKDKQREPDTLLLDGFADRKVAARRRRRGSQGDRILGRAAAARVAEERRGARRSGAPDPRLLRG